jgi:hypothetical protein
MESRKPNQHDLIFNTPFESGIRSLVLLTFCYPEKYSVRELVLLDYLVVHTADIGGPESVHPAEDFRTAELFVRRSLVQTGLLLMSRKGLIVIESTDRGFLYSASEDAGSFVDLLSSPYNSDLKQRAHWLHQTQIEHGKGSLEALLKGSKGLWLPEFQSGGNG